MIRGDASLAYQDLADVLSACDEAGIRNVRLPVRSRRRTDKGSVSAFVLRETSLIEFRNCNDPASINARRADDLAPNLLSATWSKRECP